MLRKLVALGGGMLAVVWVGWMCHAGSSAPPVSVRPLQMPLQALQPSSSEFGTTDPTASAINEVRAHARSIKALLRRSYDVEAGLSQAIDATRAAKSEPEPTEEAAPKADGGAEEPPVGATAPALSSAKACPAGCTKHGNCDAVTGTCSCPPTHEGAACNVPTMPDCATTSGASASGADSADDGFVNLSGMASEQFWWMMRDVKPKPEEEPRRRNPPYRWVGLVTCSCVRQALAVYSLQRSPEPAAWPRYIGHMEIALQRAVCVDAAASLLPLGRRSVGELWAAAPEMPRLRWSYVPIVAWLKPYPAHSPQLLPLGLVSETAFMRPTDAHLMYLAHKQVQSAAASPLPPSLPLRKMLVNVGRLQLHPPAACGAHRCHSAGWCGTWNGPWDRRRMTKTRTPSCHCLSGWTHDSHQIRMTDNRGSWNGPSDGPIVKGHEDAGRVCARQPRTWVAGMERARYARSPEQFEAYDAAHSHYGTDRWRVAQPQIPRAKACPNECLGRGTCAYGFCHCTTGYWGLDCGLSADRLQHLARARASPRIYVYEVPAALRRSCAPWTLPEDLSDRLLMSDYLEPDPERADLFWVYGCPNGDTVLPMLRWIRRTFPFWKEAVREGVPRHAMAVGHEEGWAEVWQLLGRWLGPNFDHSNHGRGWDDLHPASPTRQLASIQLHGGSDYTVDGKPRRRGVSGGAACRVCFQPGKDVAVPGFPGIMDYPDDHGRPALYRVGHGERISQCSRIAREEPYLSDGLTLAPRSHSPKMMMAGVVQTKTHGPGLYEASRLVPFNCWKNRSKEHDFLLRQTETVTISVNPWEIEKPLDPYPVTRQSSLCVVPEGKIGSYGHRSTISLMLGCVPLTTKELYSYPLFHEVVNWSSISLHVPPAQMPRLPEILRRTDVEALRRAGGPVRRRMLWTSIYGSCHLREGEGGTADAFDTLMETLRRPRRHFNISPDHRAPRAPEMMDELNLWLRKRGGEQCTKGYQCFDQWRRSCFEKY